MQPTNATERWAGPGNEAMQEPKNKVVLYISSINGYSLQHKKSCHLAEVQYKFIRDGVQVLEQIQPFSMRKFLFPVLVYFQA